MNRVYNFRMIDKNKITKCASTLHGLELICLQEAFQMSLLNPDFGRHWVMKRGDFADAEQFRIPPSGCICCISLLLKDRRQFKQFNLRFGLPGMFLKHM